MSVLENVLSKFHNPKRTGGQFLVRCPVHEDRTASLAIREGDDGRVLVHCHAGCSTEAILNTLGLEEHDLFPESGRAKPKIVATYDYTDEKGKLLYQVVRLDPKDFRQRRPDGNGGWIWNLHDTRRVLYRLHDLQGKQSVIVTEGEKDADTGRQHGVASTCNVGGAGKWNAECTKQLLAAGTKRVVVIPDNDAPGLSHAHDVAKNLKEAGLHVRLAVLPEVGPKGDLSDYMAAGHTKDELVALLRKAPMWSPEATIAPPPPEPITTFHRVEDKYVWVRSPPGIEFTLERVRRERHELCGELTVRCDISGASKTQDGALLTATFNMSSARARSERAKLLAQRARTKDDVDWFAMLEEFCERVFTEERTGAPAICLNEEAINLQPDETVNVDGLTLLLRHALILFGDGGTAKSYIALYLAGRLAQQGQRVLFADWELLSAEHQLRLYRLFGDQRPRIWYVQCDKPLVAEQDRLRKIICTNAITYMIVDSVAVACDGPPEAAEVTTAYFRAIRSLNVGTANIAHTNRSEQADKKPFGSSFWHNLARATWFCQRSEETDDPHTLAIALFNRKANLGPLQPPIGLNFRFDADRTVVERYDVRDRQEFADQIPLWQRIQSALARGPMTTAALADELQAKENTVNKAVRRHLRMFERTLSADGVQRIRLVKG